MRPFALRSPDQVGLPPPPPLESGEFQEALAELRATSGTRTAEQMAIAQKWVAEGRSYWNGVVTEMIVRYRRSEQVAAHTLALAGMAAFDAIIACFDAKFAYWLARPSMWTRRGVRMAARRAFEYRIWPVISWTNP